MKRDPFKWLYDFIFVSDDYTPSAVAYRKAKLLRLKEVSPPQYIQGKLV
jgi:hypothetical protein